MSMDDEDDDDDDGKNDDDKNDDDEEVDTVYGDHKYWAGPSSHESITHYLSPLSWMRMMMTITMTIMGE